MGDGYARLTPASLDALRLVAQQEGLVLDPVYTAKAMAGLIDLTRSGQGRWDRDQHVIFLHTGGAPALWAYDSESLIADGLSQIG